MPARPTKHPESRMSHLELKANLENTESEIRNPQFFQVTQAGLEPATSCFVDRRSDPTELQGHIQRARTAGLEPA
jgi:hypothetical protein